MRIPQDPTVQGVFNHVARHLLTQGTEASGPETWVLFDDDGRRCAIGCLINKRELSKLNPCSDESTAKVRRAIARSMGCSSLHRYTVRLLADLRRVHDETFPVVWADRLRGVAHRHGLSTSVVDKVSP